ncbi:MAG: cell division protein FtsA [Rickettsiales bacterium]|nr:cell division protein FtsA [Rickettsiales bacterium]
MKNNIFTALDIGSSKTSCAIFKITSKSDEIKILGFSTKCSVGIQNGIIENITEATTSIASAVYEAEKQASITAKKVTVNISHPFIRSESIITDSHFGGRQLSPKDLKNISDKVIYSTSQLKQTVIQCSVTRYDIDMIKNVMEPEYMFANNLKSYHTIITIPKNTTSLLKRCLHNTHLIPTNHVLSSYASSLSSSLENLHNFILLDIGGGTSDIAVFRKAHSILWAGNIPLGGENITSDISQCLAINFEEAEKLKILYGNLSAQSLYKNSSSTTNSALQTKVNLQMLNKIIVARIEEIIELILNKIPEQYRMKKIILCGGVAKTLGISEFISKRFNADTTITSPSKFSSNIKESLKSDPSFGTIAGLMHYNLKQTTQRKYFSVKKIIEWMWENF